MRTKRPKLRIFLRYTLLQLPSLIVVVLFVILLRQWVDIPDYATWGFIGIWLLKDIALFPFLWRYYDPDHFRDRFAMVGRKGVALSSLDPKGYVQIRGERWQAKTDETELPIQAGEPVCVKEIKGIQLVVTSNSKDNLP